jgi:peptidyl-prolyl cis-trans isomerase SurA
MFGGEGNPLMRKLIGTALLIIPAALTAQSDTIPLDRIVAVVGDKAILRSTVEVEYQSLLSATRRTRPDSGQAEKEMREILDQMLEVELLLNIATTEKVTIPEEELDRNVDQHLAQVRGRFSGDDAAFLSALRAQGFASIDAYRDFLREPVRRQRLPQLLIQKLRQEGRLQSVAIPDSVVIAEVARRRPTIGQKPASVSFKQFFMPTEPSDASRSAARAKAESLLVLLQKGASFDSLARAESMDSLRSRGGDLGWSRRGRYVGEFDRWVWALEPGRFSPVIETVFGYHIVKVDRRTPIEVNARHILIIPKVDSSDISATKSRADSLVALLRAGAPFDSIADKFGDPSLNNQRVIPNFERTRLPAEYEVAFKDGKAGDVIDPFSTSDSRKPDMPTFVVAVITEVNPGGDYTDEELRTYVRRELQADASVRAYLEKMKQQIYVRVFEAER